MEKFKHKAGTGTMFFQEKAHEKQPDIKGTIVTPDGNEYRVSGWKRSGNKGDFYSLAIDTPGQFGAVKHEDNGGLPF